jgi:hypothetical protein
VTERAWPAAGKSVAAAAAVLLPSYVPIHLGLRPGPKSLGHTRARRQATEQRKKRSRFEALERIKAQSMAVVDAIACM